MTSAHLIFIPAVLIVGTVLGFVLGSRSARDAMILERKRDEDRKKAREARAQRKAAKEAAGE